MKWSGIFLSLALSLLPAGTALNTSQASSSYYTISGVDPGGVIMDYVARYKALEALGVTLRIDALCVSACTTFLGIFPPDRVCVTARASLGFHEASVDDKPAAEATKAFVRYLYPKWVQEWIAKTGGLTDDPRYMYPEDMKGHINLCPGETYTEVDPNKIIAAPPPAAQEKVLFQPKPEGQ